MEAVRANLTHAPFGQVAHGYFADFGLGQSMDAAGGHTAVDDGIVLDDVIINDRALPVD